MKKLVTISREYGSGGRLIGEILADKLKVPFYDKNIIDLAAKQSGYAKDLLEGAELKAKNSFAYNLSSILPHKEGAMAGAGGNILSVNENLFLAQFKIIKEIGETEAGVIVGRCADYVLRDMPGVTNVFIHGEYEDRARRAVEIYGDEEAKIKETISTYDKARQNYYSYHTGLKWGEFKNYNLAINSSYISEEAAADLIVHYMENRRYKDETR